jgi:hypothetical protein
LTTGQKSGANGWNSTINKTDKYPI